jgi:hypothetical protein
MVVEWVPLSLCWDHVCVVLVAVFSTVFFLCTALVYVAFRCMLYKLPTAAPGLRWSFQLGCADTLRVAAAAG